MTRERLQKECQHLKNRVNYLELEKNEMNLKLKSAEAEVAKREQESDRWQLELITYMDCGHRMINNYYSKVESSVLLTVGLTKPYNNFSIILINMLIFRILSHSTVLESNLKQTAKVGEMERERLVQRAELAEAYVWFRFYLFVQCAVCDDFWFNM